MAVNTPRPGRTQAKETWTTRSNAGEVRLSADSSNPMRQSTFADAAYANQHRQSRNRRAALIVVDQVVRLMGLIAQTGS